MACEGALEWRWWNWRIQGCLFRRRLKANLRRDGEMKLVEIRKWFHCRTVLQVRCPVGTLRWAFPGEVHGLADLVLGLPRSGKSRSHIIYKKVYSLLSHWCDQVPDKSDLNWLTVWGPISPSWWGRQSNWETLSVAMGTNSMICSYPGRLGGRELFLVPQPSPK